jgi:hypothetical protein
MDPIEFKAGVEKIFYVELDLARDSLSPDWAVSAWGESAKIEITVDGKTESDHLPYVKQNHSKLPANEGKEEGDGEDSDTGDDASNNEKAVAAAEAAEEAAQQAVDAASNASILLQNVLMKSSAVLEQADLVMDDLLAA